MNSKELDNVPLVTKADYDPDLRPVDIANLFIGRQLAKRVFLDGLTQVQAIREVLPHITESSAEINSTRIMRQYKAMECLFDLLPDKIDSSEFEKIYHYLKDRAIKRGDDRLLLDVFDRLGKAHNKFKQDINMVISRDEAQIKRVEEAKKILASAGINAVKLVKNDG